MNSSTSSNLSTYSSRLATVVAFVPVVLGTVCLVVAMAYCALNASGHSGFDPCLGVVPFALLAGVGLGLSNVSQQYRLGLVTLLIGLLGAAFCYLVHYLGIMQHYEFWVKNGLQAKSSISSLFIFLYALGTASAVGLAIYKTREDSSHALPSHA